jgi:hypothetical protein
MRKRAPRLFLKGADESSADLDPGNIEEYSFKESWTTPEDLMDDDPRMLDATRNYRSLVSEWENRGAVFGWNRIEFQSRGEPHYHGLLSLNWNDSNQ